MKGFLLGRKKAPHVSFALLHPPVTLYMRVQRRVSFCVLKTEKVFFPTLIILWVIRPHTIVGAFWACTEAVTASNSNTRFLLMVYYKDDTLAQYYPRLYTHIALVNTTMIYNNQAYNTLIK